MLDQRKSSPSRYAIIYFLLYSLFAQCIPKKLFMHEQMDLSTNAAESVAALSKSLNLSEHFVIKQQLPKTIRSSYRSHYPCTLFLKVLPELYPFDPGSECHLIDRQQ